MWPGLAELTKLKVTKTHWSTLRQGKKKMKRRNCRWDRGGSNVRDDVEEEEQ